MIVYFSAASTCCVPVPPVVPFIEKSMWSHFCVQPRPVDISFALSASQNQSKNKTNQKVDTVDFHREKELYPIKHKKTAEEKQHVSTGLVMLAPCF